MPHSQHYYTPRNTSPQGSALEALDRKNFQQEETVCPGGVAVARDLMGGPIVLRASQTGVDLLEQSAGFCAAEIAQLTVGHRRARGMPTRHRCLLRVVHPEGMPHPLGSFLPPEGKPHPQVGLSHPFGWSAMASV